MNKFKALIIGGLIILIAISTVVFVLMQGKKNTESEIKKEFAPIGYNVLAAYVKEVPVNQAFSYRGVTEAKSINKIYAESDGKLISSIIEKGKIVAKGQLLASVDPTIKNASHTINNSNLEKANQDYAIALKNYQRYQNLLKENHTSQVEAENAKQQLVAADIQLQSIIQQVKISKKQVEQTSILSPASGIVIEKSVNTGDYIQPGTILGSIADLNTLLVRIYVPENVISTIQLGSSANITLDAFKNVVFKGKIKNIIPIANEAKAFPVEIELQNSPSTKLMSGMSATVSFDFKSKEIRLVVPRTAVLFEGGHHFVFTIDKNKKVIKKEVEISLTDGVNTSISKGLKMGDLVIVNGQANIDSTNFLNNYSIINK